MQASDLNVGAVPWPGPTHATSTTGSYVLEGNVSNHPAWIRPPTLASALRPAAIPFQPRPAVPVIPDRAKKPLAVQPFPRWSAPMPRTAPSPAVHAPVTPAPVLGTQAEAPPPVSQATQKPAGALLFDGRLHTKTRDAQQAGLLSRPQPGFGARSASQDSMSDTSERRHAAPLFGSHAVLFQPTQSTHAVIAPMSSHVTSAEAASYAMLATPPVTGADLGAVGTPVPNPQRPPCSPTESTIPVAWRLNIDELLA